MKVYIVGERWNEEGLDDRYLYDYNCITVSKNKAQTEFDVIKFSLIKEIRYKIIKEYFLNDLKLTRNLDVYKDLKNLTIDNCHHYDYSYTYGDGGYPYCICLDLEGSFNDEQKIYLVGSCFYDYGMGTFFEFSYACSTREKAEERFEEIKNELKKELEEFRDTWEREDLNDQIEYIAAIDFDRSLSRYCNESIRRPMVYVIDRDE